MAASKPGFDVKRATPVSPKVAGKTRDAVVRFGLNRAVRDDHPDIKVLRSGGRCEKQCGDQGRE
jgi:hypothetical protein